MEQLTELPIAELGKNETASEGPIEKVVAAPGGRIDAVVRATLRRGYYTTVVARVVAGTHLGDLLRAQAVRAAEQRATPRGGLATSLPAALIDKLREADKSVIAWLTRPKPMPGCSSPNPRRRWRRLHPVSTAQT